MFHGHGLLQHKYLLLVIVHMHYDNCEERKNGCSTLWFLGEMSNTTKVQSAAPNSQRCPGSDEVRGKLQLAKPCRVGMPGLKQPWPNQNEWGAIGPETDETLSKDKLFQSITSSIQDYPNCFLRAWGSMISEHNWIQQMLLNRPTFVIFNFIWKFLNSMLMRPIFERAKFKKKKLYDTKLA